MSKEDYIAQVNEKIFAALSKGDRGSSFYAHVMMLVRAVHVEKLAQLKAYPETRGGEA